jgi:threonine/homoserine/homoserine lactone efflux protein
MTEFLGIADYPAFVLAIVIFLLIPGPGNLALITSTGKGGVRAGLAVTLGVIAGDQVLMWLAVAGVAALLLAYLAWLGWKMLRSRPGDAPVLHMQPRAWFRQGFTITLLNPKAIVFYMAFFPLFVDPAHHQGLVSFAAMATTIAVLTLIYGVAMVTLVRVLADRLRANPRVSNGLERLAGVFLIGFGVKLALGK